MVEKNKKLDKFNSCHLIPFVIYYDYLFVFMRMPIAMSGPSVAADDGGMKQDLDFRLRVLKVLFSFITFRYQ